MSQYSFPSYASPRRAASRTGTATGKTVVPLRAVPQPPSPIIPSPINITINTPLPASFAPPPPRAPSNPAYSPAAAATAAPTSPRTIAPGPPPRYYFAYGSNLWHRQMHARCPSSLPLGLGVLKGFKWLISARGFANIVMSAPDEVWGLVWLLSPTDEQVLDRYEGVSQRSYDKYDLAVTLLSGEEKLCLVYVDPVQAAGRPWAEYVDRMNAGLKDSPLPEAYVRDVIRPFIPAPPPPVVSIPRAQDVPVRCYFAYGPEMALRALGRLAPQARVLDTGLLPRHRWVVGVSGKPNLLPAASEVVYGVVSSLSRTDERRLDEAFNVARGEREKIWLDVQMENGRGVVRCLVYLDPRPAEGSAGEELVREMQEALWDAKLPTGWVEEVIRPRMIGLD
ncbi:hypothetical protein CALVIDRAFT_532377 [Calocera viscosa TUFC12733]|uniref:gamma-glutamylcyclotransferase n=1 Tax=Calocera viscosa (strain TUFC12733) TaxID=1330018 RepID=A0A167S5T8_CALVF|nr:hypothetical protein CALVIDRAFT_532377 [Calocera viscosa TUFC12733]